MVIRKKPICIACRKAHDRRDCPKARRGISDETRSQREFLQAAMAVQSDLRRRRNA